MGDMADMLLDQMWDDPNEYYEPEDSDFVLSYKRCWHCGKDGLKWGRYEGKYRLYDPSKHNWHYCTPELKEISLRMQRSKLNPKRKIKGINMIEMFKCNVAGVKFGDIQKVNSKLLKPQQILKLFWEKDNQYDPLAIKVVLDGHKLGYIPKEMTHLIHVCRDEGLKVHCEIHGYFPTNPTYQQLVVSVCNSENKRKDGDIEI